MLSILQPEITTLESEVAALQAQILAAQQRITLLNEAESVAGGSLEALKGAIQKVTDLAPGAIANLKSAVLNLFSGSENSSDDDFGFGNQPIDPAPQPEPLNGQVCELASILEDGKSESLQGQSVEIACIMSDAPKQLCVELIHVPTSNCVAYQRREDGEIICCYVGGNNKNRLKDWGSWLCNQHSVGSGFELREAKRMTAYKWELKIWGMSLKQVNRLAETDTTKTPPSRYHVASFPIAERLLAPEIEGTPEEVEQVAKLEQEAQLLPLMFQVGNRVEIVSERHGVELVGQTGIVTAGTATGAAVDVGGTLRWFCVDELAQRTAISPAPQEPTEEEKVALASIQPPTYNPYPIGRRGAAANA